MNILGISAYYHDSAAALISDGVIVAAAQEERFSRKKHDPGFPANSIRSCLDLAGLDFPAIDKVVFYDKPLLKFERLLETYVSYAPKGFSSFVAAMPVWLKEKLYLKSILKKELRQISGVSADLPELLFSQHHQSHAASAFFPSPFQQAAVLCMDGVGEWAATSAWLGDGNKLMPLWEINFPHSLGLLYSAFTYFSGFKVNSGEYKLMGLAPYGEPKYADLILQQLIDLKPDGSFRLRMKYFDFATGLTMTNRHFADLFGRPPRDPESEITQMEMDIASSIQLVTEDIVLKLSATVRSETGCKNLCLAGGVGLNCVANGRLMREGPFDDIWIQPAAGDAGGAIGAALAVWHQHLNQPRIVSGTDSMQGGYLGPAFDQSSIDQTLDELGACYKNLDDQPLFEEIAHHLDAGKVVGWFQGRMEFGPRALGGRSILGDPRNQAMQSVMNLKIKYRESFRPFAPAVLAEQARTVFDLERDSPYMMLVAEIDPALIINDLNTDQDLFGLDKLKVIRSRYPAITHVDYSARIQTVHAQTNPRFHQLLKVFYDRTDCPAVINTSFNVRGEPIVCTPEDAFRCFMRTGMDFLVLENAILDKAKQPEWDNDDQWQQEFALD